jgi:hypothetical protein
MKKKKKKQKTNPQSQLNACERTYFLLLFLVSAKKNLVSLPSVELHSFCTYDQTIWLAQARLTTLREESLISSEDSVLGQKKERHCSNCAYLKISDLLSLVQSSGRIGR